MINDINKNDLEILKRNAETLSKMTDVNIIQQVLEILYNMGRKAGKHEIAKTIIDSL